MYLVPIPLLLAAVSLLHISPIFALTSTGSTVEVNGISYYLPGKPFTSISSSRAAGTGSSIPVTIVKTNSSGISISALQAVIKTFGEIDDVWNPGFSSGKTYLRLDNGTFEAI